MLYWKNNESANVILTSLFKILKKELRILSLFNHNHSSLALFELFLQEVQAKKAAKTAQKVVKQRDNLWREIQIGTFF